jgi:hypothetical protein
MLSHHQPIIIFDGKKATPHSMALYGSLLVGHPCGYDVYLSLFLNIVHGVVKFYLKVFCLRPTLTNTCHFKGRAVVLKCTAVYWCHCCCCHVSLCFISFNSSITEIKFLIWNNKQSEGCNARKVAWRMFEQNTPSFRSWWGYHRAATRRASLCTHPSAWMYCCQSVCAIVRERKNHVISVCRFFSDSWSVFDNLALRKHRRRLADDNCSSWSTLASQRYLSSKWRRVIGKLKKALISASSAVRTRCLSSRSDLCRDSFRESQIAFARVWRLWIVRHILSRPPDMSRLLGVANSRAATSSHALRR